MILFLTFGLALFPGVAAFWLWRGPRVEVESSDTAPDMSLPEIAVLRDGAVGATRWAFAGLILKLARDGHCTLVRTRKRLWLRTGPALTVDLHANLPALSPFEQTVLRQLGRHDTLGGFGFAGSTFRRRTLRDVRADLVERGWLADRSRRSNACLALGLTLLIGAAVGVLAGLPLLFVAASAGMGGQPGRSGRSLSRHGGWGTPSGCPPRVRPPATRPRPGAPARRPQPCSRGLPGCPACARA